MPRASMRWGRSNAIATKVIKEVGIFARISMSAPKLEIGNLVMRMQPAKTQSEIMSALVPKDTTEQVWDVGVLTAIPKMARHRVATTDLEPRPKSVLTVSGVIRLLV